MAYDGHAGPATTKQEAAAAVRAAKVRLGLTWAQIAEAVGRPAAWTTTALLGQHPMSDGEASAAAALLDAAGPDAKGIVRTGTSPVGIVGRPTVLSPLPG